MRSPNRWLILGILALCAIACYAVGLIAGVVVLVAIGAILELSFWVGVFRNFIRAKK
jgi:hypothetical protein